MANLSHLKAFDVFSRIQQAHGSTAFQMRLEAFWMY